MGFTMHLAGLLGVPGVSIFGPTSSRQWGPTGMHVVQAGLPCAPCAQVTSGDFAPDCPVPFAPDLEKVYRPSHETIGEALIELIEY